VLVGLATHVGSQLSSTTPYVQSARVLFGIARAVRDGARGRSLSFLDTGGGFGIDYASPFPPAELHSSRPPLPAPADYVRAVRSEQRGAGLDDLALYVEPGRSLVASHGVLLARVVQAKVANEIRWLMIDAGMNDLLRPALYQAAHRIVPLEHHVAEPNATPWRVVGPVCESTDDFGHHPLHLEPPRAVAILDAGAYGYAMASQYNGRQLPVEIFVAGGRVVASTARRSAEAWAEERAAAGA